MTTFIASLGALVGLAAFLTAMRETAKWLAERKSNEIGTAVGQLGTLLDRFREENRTLVDLNDKQSSQIEELKNENDRLEILVRSLTQQNLDISADRERVKRERDQLMREYHELIGRMKGLTEEGGDAA